MKQAWWRTGRPIKHTQPVVRPTAGQLLRQVAALLAVAALWGGLFLILLGATRSSNVAFVAQQGTSTQQATRTAASAATSTPIARATEIGGAVATATAIIVANSPTPAATTPLTSTGTVTATVSFQREVLPIFTEICVKCHGGEKTQKSLVLKSYDDLMQGSEDGPVIEPGDPANSLLVQMVVQGKMPKNGPKLLPRQIQIITDWVKAGAPDN
jgi:mono/diheme cytochrome c family protein